MIYGHKATLFTCKSRSAQGGQRNENEGGDGVRKRRANAEKGMRYLRAYEGGKKWRLSCSHGSLQKCFIVQAERQQRRSHLNTACPWQVLSAFLPLLRFFHRLLVFSLRPPRISLTLHSPFSYLIIYIHRVIRVLIARSVLPRARAC